MKNNNVAVPGIPLSIDIDIIDPAVWGTGATVKGGASSGNWGHAGRPGIRGGSLPKGERGQGKRDIPSYDIPSVRHRYYDQKGLTAKLRQTKAIGKTYLDAYMKAIDKDLTQYTAAYAETHKQLDAVMSAWRAGNGEVLDMLELGEYEVSEDWTIAFRAEGAFYPNIHLDNMPNAAWRNAGFDITAKIPSKPIRVVAIDSYAKAKKYLGEHAADVMQNAVDELSTAMERYTKAREVSQALQHKMQRQFVDMFGVDTTQYLNKYETVDVMHNYPDRVLKQLTPEIRDAIDQKIYDAITEVDSLVNYDVVDETQPMIGVNLKYSMFNSGANYDDTNTQMNIPYEVVPELRALAGYSELLPTRENYPYTDRETDLDVDTMDDELKATVAHEYGHAIEYLLYDDDRALLNEYRDRLEARNKPPLFEYMTTSYQNGSTELLSCAFEIFAVSPWRLARQDPDMFAFIMGILQGKVAAFKGGTGSGHHGHVGILGKRGGSAPKGASRPVAVGGSQSSGEYFADITPFDRTQKGDRDDRSRIALEREMLMLDKYLTPEFLQHYTKHPESAYMVDMATKYRDELSRQIVAGTYKGQVEALLNVARVEAKKNVISTLSQETGISPTLVSTAIKCWAHSSNDNNAMMLGLQKAMKDEFGANMSQWQEQKYAAVQPKSDFLTKYYDELQAVAYEALAAAGVTDTSKYYAYIHETESSIIRGFLYNVPDGDKGSIGTEDSVRSIARALHEKVTVLAEQYAAETGVDITALYPSPLNDMLEGNFADVFPDEKQRNLARLTVFVADTLAKGELSTSDEKMDIRSEHMMLLTNAEARALLRAIYRQTQAWFAKMGYKPTDTLVLYRGFIDLEVPRAIGDINFEAGRAGIDKYDTALYHGNAMEAWTSSVGIAYTFGDGHSSGNSAYVFSARVPISRIFCNALTGFGCLNELEFVIMNDNPFIVGVT